MQERNLKKSSKRIDGRVRSGWIDVDTGEFFNTKAEANVMRKMRSDKKPVARRNVIAVADATLRMRDVVLAWAFSNDFQLKHYNLMNEYMEGRRKGYAGLKTMQRAGTVLEAVNVATAWYKQYDARKDKRYLDDALYSNPTWCEDRDWVDSEPLDELSLEINALLDARHAEFLANEPNPELTGKEYERSILSKDKATYIHSKGAVTVYEEKQEDKGGLTEHQPRWSQDELFDWTQRNTTQQYIRG